MSSGTGAGGGFPAPARNNAAALNKMRINKREGEDDFIKVLDLSTYYMMVVIRMVEIKSMPRYITDTCGGAKNAI
jgi:hypothetical protein